MIRFGTGGWRAIIADGFTKENVQKLSAALAFKMRDEGREGVIIGFDRRFLSDTAARWSAEVFAALGIHSQVIRTAAPTPLVMFEVKRQKMPYGLAITASHNPAEYNGVKVFTAGGRDADETETGMLERYIDGVTSAPSMPYDKGIASGLIQEIDPQNAYIDSILEAIDTDTIRKAGLRVVLDPMFGVSRTSLQTILMTARCQVDVIHERHDTLFGGRLPTPNVDTLGTLRNYVVENRCDLGIATDGDADRLGVIDEAGRFLHPNEILVLLYYYLVKYKGWKGPAVRNLATTHLLDRVAELLGETCYETPVGFKHISAQMRETDAVIGGESSGGLTVRGHIAGKDGIYAAALLVEMMAVTGRKLSEIYEEITKHTGRLYAAETDTRFAPERRGEIEQKLQRTLPDFPQPVERVSHMDGCKIYFTGGGWALARFSGTEPLLRIFCEMDDRDEAEQICRVLRTYLDV